MYVITDSSTIHEIAKNVTYVRYGSPADDNSLWGVYYHSDGIKSADGIHSTLSYYDSRYFTIRLSDLPEEITIDLKNYIQ